MSSAFQIDHEYIRPQYPVSRSPCPALNALANQGYVNRMGTDISFCDMLRAIRTVYNLSLPLAFFLTFSGFITSGKLSFSPKASEISPKLFSLHWITDLFMIPTWTLDLVSLSVRGASKIAHNASLVHPDDIPSTSPDPVLLAEILSLAQSRKDNEGLTLYDLGMLRVKREATSSHPLSWLHEQVSLGECGLAWAVLQEQDCEAPHISDGKSCCAPQPKKQTVIPLSTLRQWFGEERLPDNWWSGVRPCNQIGLLGARKCAGEVARLSETIRSKKLA